MTTTDNEPGTDSQQKLTTIKIKVPANLARAYQRCNWIIINEHDRDQLGIMEEMVEDFLKKYGC